MCVCVCVCLQWHQSVGVGDQTPKIENWGFVVFLDKALGFTVLVIHSTLSEGRLESQPPLLSLHLLSSFFCLFHSPFPFIVVHYILVPLRAAKHLSHFPRSLGILQGAAKKNVPRQKFDFLPNG